MILPLEPLLTARRGRLLCCQCPYHGALVLLKARFGLGRTILPHLISTMGFRLEQCYVGLFI